MLRCLIALVAVAPVVAADWPQFRGPTGDGHYSGAAPPTEWGVDKNVAWKTTIPGKGWSSPIVVKGKIYLTSAVPVDNADLSLDAICLDAASGKIDWQKRVFKQEKAKAPNIHDKNSHASSTPTCDGERLYVHFGHMGTAALDLKGSILWTRSGLYSKPVHGNGGSPILVAGKLVFSVDALDKQAVIALQANDGKTAWDTPRNANASRNFSFGTPTVMESGGKKVVVSVGSDIIAAYDVETGKEQWRYKFKGYSIIPKPVVGHGLVYISTGYDSAKMIAVKPDGSAAWTSTKNAPHTPSPLLVGDEIYTVSDKGVLSCSDAKTGEVLWEDRVKGNYSASPIVADGKIYLTSEEGKGTVVETGKSFSVVSETDMKEKTFASFAAADGALFVRTETKLYKFASK